MNEKTEDFCYVFLFSDPSKNKNSSAMKTHPLQKQYNLKKLYNTLISKQCETSVFANFPNAVENSKIPNNSPENHQNQLASFKMKVKHSKSIKTEESDSKLLWDIIAPYFKPVDDTKLFSNFLVPSIIPKSYPHFDIHFPHGKSLNDQTIRFPKSKRVSYTSILTSCILFFDHQFKSDSAFSNHDISTEMKPIQTETNDDYINLDVDEKILLELEYIGLGKEPLEAISPELLDEYKTMQEQRFLAAEETNLIKNEVSQQIMKKKEEIQHYNYLCKCIEFSESNK